MITDCCPCLNERIVRADYSESLYVDAAHYSYVSTEVDVWGATSDLVEMDFDPRA